MVVSPVVEVHLVRGKKHEKYRYFFDNNGRARIRDAVSEAESHTSAEIVPVLTDCSGRYDRAEDLFGFFFAIVSLAFGRINFQDVITDGAWQSQQAPNLQHGLGHNHTCSSTWVCSRYFCEMVVWGG